MAEDQEILRSLDSIEGRLDVVEKWVDDTRALAESGKGYPVVLKEVDDMLGQVVEAGGLRLRRGALR